MVEMFTQPIVGTLCCFIDLFNYIISALNHFALMSGHFQTKVLFEAADSQAKGETTAIQLRTHPSQQNFFDLLGTPKLHAAREHMLNHIASRIQQSLRIGWLDVQPIKGTRLEDHHGKQSLNSVEWFHVASLEVSSLPQQCPTEL